MVPPGVTRVRHQLARRITGDRSTAIDRRSRNDDDNLKLLLTFGLRRDSNCLDVGANQGLFLREFRRIAPEGRHIAYEPVPHLAAKLAEDFPEMDIRQRALSKWNGESTFVHVVDPDMEGYSGLTDSWVQREVRTESITVATERLDDTLPEGWLPDFVKIDVEGAELDVLKGARQVLASDAVQAFLELHPSVWAARGVTAEQIRAELAVQHLTAEPLDPSIDIWHTEGISVRLRRP